MQEFARARAWNVIGLAQWIEIRDALPDVSETTIREALRESGTSVEQPWRGIELHTLAELETALTEFSGIYSGDPALRKYCREQVIAAKNTARIISRSARVDPSKRALKAEMVEWMLVWLGDPALFPSWVVLRRDNLAQSA